MDFEAHSGGDALNIQVVRADAGQDVWRALGREGEWEGESAPEMLAELLLRSIQHKANRGGDVLLALDATDLTGFALPAVVEAFRERHCEDARDVGFKEVWLAGPVKSLVWRLDE